MQRNQAKRCLDGGMLQAEVPVGFGGRPLGCAPIVSRPFGRVCLLVAIEEELDRRMGTQLGQICDR
jgi:hypothetical protein